MEIGEKVESNNKLIGSQCKVRFKRNSIRAKHLEDGISMRNIISNGDMNLRSIKRTPSKKKIIHPVCKC